MSQIRVKLDIRSQIEGSVLAIEPWAEAFPLDETELIVELSPTGVIEVFIGKDGVITLGTDNDDFTVTRNGERQNGLQG